MSDPTQKKIPTVREKIFGCLGLLLIALFVWALAATILDRDSSKNEDSAKSERDKSPAERITGLMKDQFGGRLRSAKLYGQGTPESPALVMVEFNADDADPLKKSIETEMAKAYALIFQSGVTVAPHATLLAYMPGKDQFGKSYEVVVYRTILRSAQAAQINWKETSSVRWSEVWETAFLNPDVRDQ